MIKIFIKRILLSFNYRINKINSDYINYPVQNTNEGILINTIEKLQIDLLLDIGANNGDWALEIRENGYAGKIYSFEPQSVPFKQLELLSSKDQKWHTFNYGLGNSNNEKIINISKNSVSSSILPMLKKHEKAEPNSVYRGKEKIKIRKLDSIHQSIITKNEKVFLKLDTQGYEFDILKGSVQFMEKISGIQIEMSLKKLYKGELDFSEMKKFLNEIGFVLIHIHDGFKDKNTGELLQVDALFQRE